MATMNDQTMNDATLTSSDPRQALVCWRAIFAGLLLSLLVYIGLIALGAAVGGSAASNVIQNGKNANGLANGAGIWVGISVLLSMVAGSYFASRLSRFVTPRVGAAQGLIITSLFMAFLMFGAGETVGAIGSGLRSVLSGMSTGVGTLADNTTVQDTMNQALAGQTLKSDPDVVAQGLANRLIRGDIDSAKNYLAYQTGMSRTDVDTTVARIQQDVQNAARDAGIAAAKGVSAAGWTLFFTILLSMICSAVGGMLGAMANSRKPLPEQVALSRLVPRPI